MEFVEKGMINPYSDGEKQHNDFDGPFQSIGMISLGVLQLQERIDLNVHKPKMVKKTSVFFVENQTTREVAAIPTDNSM